MKNKIVFFFFIMGVIFTTLLILIGGHELGHYIDLRRQNVTVYEVCILGWKNNLPYSNPAVGWVESEGGKNIDNNFSVFWDCTFTFDREKCLEYYGVRK